MSLEHYEAMWRQSGRAVSELNRRGMRIGLRNRRVAWVAVGCAVVAALAAVGAVVANPFFVGPAQAWPALCLAVALLSLAGSAYAVHTYHRMLLGTVRKVQLDVLGPALLWPALGCVALAVLSLLTVILEPGRWLAGVLAVLLATQAVLLFLANSNRAVRSR